jgi:hypothetical protein
VIKTTEQGDTGVQGDTPPRRIVARFQPQAWVNDHAINVDAEGPATFDVTAYCLEHYTRDELATIRDDSYESDDLRMNGPEWVREWYGPYYIEVEESIREYLGEG